jgi:LPPG:FO 2-phospho-L-lactate transferase
VTVTVALAGGVGAAKFLRGLCKIVSSHDLLIIGNTGDDLELYGLHISPDLDIVMYTLAGVVDETKGWGIKDDTFHFIDSLRNLGFETWFRIGDRDLATHIIRTKLLSEGATLAEATAKLCKRFGVEAKLTPMTNEKVRTKILSDNIIIDFQEYFVKNKTENEVKDVIFQGAENAEPAPGVIEALTQAERIIICPSNPILSIGPMLTIPKIREAIIKRKAETVAISPIIAGKTLKGPADKVLRSMGYEASVIGVARYYREFINRIIIDRADSAQKPELEKLGFEVTIADTVMKRIEDSVNLAKVAAGSS